MTYDVIVVGAGIAGLTASAYIAQSNHSVLLLEKESKIGGLVNSFEVDGFLYDAGARGIVDSGIIKPMLKQLNIDLPMVRSVVTLGIEEQFMTVDSHDSIDNYKALLSHLYPENKTDIESIINEIKVIIDIMDVLYGIDNPLFMDLKADKTYLMKTVLPWVFQYLKKSRQMKHYLDPVDEHLAKLTNNQSLIDIISQHFFQKTPTSFALSYFSLYLDYSYPLEGTQGLANALSNVITTHQGVISTGVTVESIDPVNSILTDSNGKTYAYKQLIWAADQTSLYEKTKLDSSTPSSLSKTILKHREFLRDKHVGDSIYTLFMAVDLPPTYFQSIMTPHLFYTPDKSGQSNVFKRLASLTNETSKEVLFQWMNDYLEKTTYEISIPNLRNPNLAPEGKTGLIISTLLDYDYIKSIQTLGYYEEFKQMAQQKIIDVLSRSLFKGFNDHVIHAFSSTPLTIEKLSGNRNGGITGWSFTNAVNPSISKTSQVTKSVKTKLPNILQAGQWVYSPSGLPVSVMTGKIAADQAIKSLKK